MFSNPLVDGTHPKSWNIFRLGAVLILIAAVSVIVYYTGGTQAAFTHLMYIPIIFAAFYFGIKGTVATALLSGLALGPLMPTNVETGLMQDAASWIFRLVFFVALGLLIAVLFKYVKTYRKAEIKSAFVNVLTGLPNMNKLKSDLEEMIDKKTEFSLMGFRVTNLDDINRYTTYETGILAVKKATEILKSDVGGTVYSVFTNEFAAILPHVDIIKAKTIAAEYLYKIYAPLEVAQYDIELIAKCGIVNYPLQADGAEELIRKMGIALGQKTDEMGIIVYNNDIEQKSKKRIEIINSLYNALKNEEFYMVYQPKRPLCGGGVTGVEALIRWDRGTEMQVNTEEFIKIAEEVGAICEITKWVITHVIGQIKAWRDEGLSVSVALNISPRDLRDCDVVDYLIKSIEESGLPPGLVEVELTERGILENEKEAILLLGMLKDKNIKISLDDFGTGYNSLIDLIKIPIDFIKIDKTFIDGFLNDAYKTMIESIIAFAHKTGKKVVAEGVEEKAQLDMLDGLGCDYIQGYYFSKPLPPGDLKRFISAEK